MRLEHAESTASSALFSCQPVSNWGSTSPSNRTARISASSSTRSGLTDTERHWKSRCANFHFSSSIPSNVCSYVASNVFGKLSKVPRILEGKHRRRFSNCQYTHLNLKHLFGDCSEKAMRGIAYIPCALSESALMTNSLSSADHFRILRSECTTDLMYPKMSAFCPVSSSSDTRNDAKGSR